MASDDTIKSMQLYQKLDSGTTSPITPVIDLDQCQVGTTVANACTNLGISGITGSTSLPDFLIELCKKAVANSTQQSQIVGVTTQYAITTSAVTQDTIKQVGTWSDTAPTPTEANPYLWKREATKYRTIKHETKNGKDTQITTEFYLDSNGKEVAPNNESLIPWIYTFCGARGANGTDGVATQVTVYKSGIIGTKVNIISDRTDPNWESQDYCPSGWQFSIPGVKAGYDIWKSSREKNKDGWTDFSTPTIYNSAVNTSTIATFILNPTQLTLELQASTNNECYYKIEFLNAVKEKYSLIISSKVKTSKEKSFKISLPTGLMSKGYDTTSTTAISVYNEGNLLQLDTQYTITSNLGGFDPAKLVNYVQWFNCTTANVYCYSDAALSQVLSITNYVRTGMEGYYSKEDSSGKIIIYSTDSEVTALNITAEGVRSTVSGKGANLVYGARCSKEAMQKQSINAGAYMQFITGSGIQYQTIDEKVVSTGDRINVVSGKIGFLVNSLVKGKTYTLQFMCCQYNSTKSDIKIKFSSSGNMTIPVDSGFTTIVADVPANWTTITCNECSALTFIAEESYNAFFLKGSFSIAKVQLEEGNAPTTWHDYNSGITSSIIQEFDNITTKIEEVGESCSEVKQQADEISSTVTDTLSGLASTLKVQNGRIVAQVSKDEKRDIGFEITDKGTTFTGNVAAEMFELRDGVLISNADNVKTITEGEGILYFVTGKVAKTLNLCGTDISDNTPVIVIRNNDQLYFRDLTASTTSGTTVAGDAFYTINNAVASKITVRCNESDHTYYDIIDNKLNNCTYYTLEGTGYIFEQYKTANLPSNVTKLSKISTDKVYVKHEAKIYQVNTFTNGQRTQKGYVIISGKLTYDTIVGPAFIPASSTSSENTKNIKVANSELTLISEKTVDSSETANSSSETITITMYSEEASMYTQGTLDSEQYVYENNGLDSRVDNETHTVAWDILEQRTSKPTTTKVCHTPSNNIVEMDSVTYYDTEANDWNTLS